MKRTERRQLLVDERRDLHDFLTDLRPTDWTTPSLCGEWRVIDVAAHLASFLTVTPVGLMTRALRFGTSTRGANARSTAAWATKGPKALAAAFASPHLGLGEVAPGWAVCEAVVHHEDMRRPVGARRVIPEGRLRVALTFLCRAPTGTGANRRRRGLRLDATDIGWRLGTGPEVAGPAEALLLALAGRRVGLEALTGPGVAILGERLPTGSR